MKSLKLRFGILAVLLCVHQVRAQSTFGSVVGSVKDASDAAVPAALITIRDVDENLSRSTSTNDQGLYQFLNLRP